MLAAGLAAEAIARESDRIENFEADVRERAMFNRKRKAEEFMARREAEIAAYLAGQGAPAADGPYLGPYSSGPPRAPPPPTPPIPPTRRAPAGQERGRL